jgi:hypothetical protein
MQRRVAMSRVTATYRSNAPVGAAAGRPVAEAIAAAGQTFGESVGAVILFAIAALPWALLLGAAIWAWRRFGRRKPPIRPDPPA